MPEITVQIANPPSKEPKSPLFLSHRRDGAMGLATFAVVAASVVCRHLVRKAEMSCNAFIKLWSTHNPFGDLTVKIQGKLHSTIY